MNKTTCRAHTRTCKHSKRKTNVHYLIPVYLGFALLLVGGHVVVPNLPKTPEVAHASTIISPLPEAKQATASAPLTVKQHTVKGSPTPTPTPSEHTQEKIEAYIRALFGRDGHVAVAVSRNECNPSNRAYPKCVYHTEHEYSVGIFQINLYNARQWIHASKVPGETMAEKIESLKDPFINALVAHKIYSDSNGFTPWSAYTNGNYKKDL